MKYSGLNTRIIFSLLVALLAADSFAARAQEIGRDPFGRRKAASVRPKRQPVVKTKPLARGFIAPAPVENLPAAGKRFALVVGVDSYSDGQISGLNGASNDAALLAETLINHGGFVPEQVLTLSSKKTDANQPTRANILQKLTLLARSVPKDGMLLVAFSGHGIERNGQAFLLPSDAKVDFDINLLNETCINVERIKDQIRQYGIQQVLFVLDTCRNELVKSRSGNADALTDEFTKKFRFDVQNREVRAFATLYGTSAGERAFEYTQKQHGYFTWALVEALGGRAADADGNVTLSSIVNYVQTEVPKRVRLEIGQEQHPFAEIGGYKADRLVVSSASAVQASNVNSDPHVESSRNAVAFASKGNVSPVFEAETVNLDAAGQVLAKSSVKTGGYKEMLPDGIEIEMVKVHGGKFRMGMSEAEEKPFLDECAKAQVTPERAAQWTAWQISNLETELPDFHLGRFEITQAQWKAVARLPKVGRDLNPDPSKFKGDNLPVENVSWSDAVEFCERLSRYSNCTYRLPTEAEWEYACRAGSRTAFSFGDAIDAALVNFDGNFPYAQGRKSEFRDRTLPVGSMKAANAFGLFDMHGNVWEWCLDDWNEPPSETASKGVSTDSKAGNKVKSLRGGGWYTPAMSCRSTFRAGLDQTTKDSGTGFRVLCVH